MAGSLHKFSSRTCRISTMIALTGSFFFVELIVGYMTNSIALVADSFHMLSDVLSLIIGLYAIRVAKKDVSNLNTYGWARAETLGALVNGVFLLSLCMSILIESVQRLFAVEDIEQPELLLVVGGIGLLINLLGLLIFHDGHGHSHAGGGGHGHAEEVVDGHAAGAATKTGGLNMRGVFLHVLGDALGSVAVIISALVVWLSDWGHRHYLDPLLSLLIVVIILSSTIPLVRRSAFILLQGIPEQTDMDAIRASIGQVAGVVDVHELHVWQLSDEKLIASVHVTVAADDEVEFMPIAAQIKQVFHDRGIHSTTVQPEFLQPTEDVESRACRLECIVSPGSADCSKNVCCAESKLQLTRRTFDQSISPLKKPPGGRSRRRRWEDTPTSDATDHDAMGSSDSSSA